MAVLRTFAPALFALFLITATPLRGWAQEETEDSKDAAKEPAEAEQVPQAPKHILTDMPKSAEGVETTFAFPDNPKLRMTSGEEVEILCGFYNGGDVPLNVTHVAGSINSPMDFRVYVQNWTSPMYTTVVPPDTQGSFSIKIKPDVNLQARDFIVSMTTFYESADGVKFSNTFFNNTVYVVEPTGFLDLETGFMYLFIVAVVGLVAGAIFKALQSAGVVKKSKARKVETGTRGGTTDENEWLKGTAALGSASKKRIASKRK